MINKFKTIYHIIQIAILAIWFAIIKDVSWVDRVTLDMGERDPNQEGVIEDE
jgi:hypothetical protein